MEAEELMGRRISEIAEESHGEAVEFMEAVSCCFLFFYPRSLLLSGQRDYVAMNWISVLINWSLNLQVEGELGIWKW